MFPVFSDTEFFKNTMFCPVIRWPYAIWIPILAIGKPEIVNIIIKLNTGIQIVLKVLAKCNLTKYFALKFFFFFKLLANAGEENKTYSFLHRCSKFQI